ncbi:cupin domain-containing protein [Rahnella aceris]|uniref:cupin domain-containing protein n=1 Tax=Rahnella sp. (strain Y9602) TaxID=2703885 RepID=UPI0014216BF3|nr:cupin [Rahnella aceris]
MHLDRRRFVTLLGVIALMPIPQTGFATPREVAMNTLRIDKPDGGVPNNTLPVLIYHRVIPPDTADNADYLEHLFRANGWPPQWRYPVYTFTHFHSNTPEVLGVFAGTAKLQLGGEHGNIIEVKVGDVLLLPAGIGHKQISADDDFMLVGAYPPGIKADLCHDELPQLAARTKAVNAVPLPATDPVTGHSEGSMLVWHQK